MRVLGFSKMWDKLQQPEFTTFRFIRRDRDWQVGELAQVIYKPRRKGGGDFMGIGEIVGKEQRSPDAEFPLKGILTISDDEANADGFVDYEDMRDWLYETHKSRCDHEPINKLTVRWQKDATTG